MAGWSSGNMAGTSPNRHRLDFYMTQGGQNYSTNQTTVNWSLYLVHVSGSPGSWNNNASSWSANIGGVGYGGTTTYDFRNNLYGSKLLAAGSTTFTHDANGYLSVYGSGAFSSPSNHIGSGSVGGTLGLDRIPKAPTTNGMPVVSNLQPTSVTLSWPANTNNNGAAIDQYLLRVNKNNPADAAGYVDYPLSPSTLSYTVTGLTPGTQYYAVVYAHNSQGYAPKSSQASFKTLSGAYVRRGTEWRPTEVLVRRNGVWKPGEVFVYKGGTWKPAS